MKTYTITIENKEDKSEMHIFQITAEDIMTLSDNLEKTANYVGHVELELADGTILEVDQHSEHGYNANLYENQEAFDNGNDPIGGGLCTGTLSDAIEMAITCR